MTLRKWLGRKLWGWSIRVYDDWHDIDVVDGKGNRVASFGCYGQYAATWQMPYDIRFKYRQEDKE